MHISQWVSHRWYLRRCSWHRNLGWDLWDRSSWRPSFDQGSQSQLDCWSFQLCHISPMLEGSWDTDPSFSTSLDWAQDGMRCTLTSSLTSWADMYFWWAFCFLVLQSLLVGVVWLVARCLASPRSRIRSHPPRIQLRPCLTSSPSVPLYAWK